MDVNNTRFHLLLGERDWTERLPVPADPACGVAWDAERGGVSLRPLLYRFPRPEAHRLSDRRGAARDRYGHWYTVDADETGIVFLPADGGEAQPFWPGDDAPCASEAEPGTFAPSVPPALPPLRLRGLAVTTRHYLVAGVTDPPGLLVFDLHAGGAPLSLAWPAGLAFSPLDLAPRPDGGVWVLDVDPSRGTPRYWALDRYLRVETRPSAREAAAPPGTFFPSAGPAVRLGERTFPPALTAGHAIALDVDNPIALEALPDDSVLVLSLDAAGETWLHRYRFTERRGGPLSLRALLQSGLDLVRDAQSGDLDAWQGYDLAFVPDAPPPPHRVTGTLYVAGRDGNQAFAFTLSAEGDELTVVLADRYLPMRRFGGRGIVAAGGQVYYDLAGRWLPLAPQPKPRYCPEGVLETRVFDGRLPGCVWHRLLLDAALPSGATVRVESRAADEEGLLAGTGWREEPLPYLRGTGTELPYDPPFAAGGRRDGTGTWELLFQEARGRFLQLRLTLAGTGRNTPRLYALRAYYPRFSYLKAYLPDVYQEDEAAASFLERFLANVEGSFTELEGRIAEAQRLFDPATVDDAYLDWLGTWVGALMDPSYDAHKRRLFLRHAPALFAQRGTLGGLLRTLRLTLDPCPDDTLFAPEAIACDAGTTGSGTAGCGTAGQVTAFGVRIVERFLTRAVPGVAYGDPTDVPAPRLTQPSAAWSPAQGAAPLHEHYRTFLLRKHGSAAALRRAWQREADPSFDPATLPLSPVLPSDAAQRADWRQFVRSELDFPYAEVTAADADAYRAFLVRRYRQVERLNQAYLTAYRRFEEIGLPAETDFPRQDTRLDDWIQFVSLVLPLPRTAHRFTVLVPTTPESSPAEQSEQMALVRRIVEQEKPAHTVFDVQPYWALFRVGSARVALDTLLGEGSRYVALLLGHGHLAGSYLAPAPPWDAADRLVTGRDRTGTAL